MQQLTIYLVTEQEIPYQSFSHAQHTKLQIKLICGDINKLTVIISLSFPLRRITFFFPVSLFPETPDKWAEWK